MSCPVTVASRDQMRLSAITRFMAVPFLCPAVRDRSQWAQIVYGVPSRYDSWCRRRALAAGTTGWDAGGWWPAAGVPLLPSYALSVICFEVLTAPWPEGVKLPFAVSFILRVPLSTRRPLLVSTIFAVALPLPWNTSVTVATRTFAPCLGAKYQARTRRPGDGAVKENE